MFFRNPFEGNLYIVWGARTESYALMLSKAITQVGGHVLHATRSVSTHERVHAKSLTEEEQEQISCLEFPIMDCDVTSQESVKNFFEFVESIHYPLGGLALTFAGMHGHLIHGGISTQGRGGQDLGPKLLDSLNTNVLGIIRVIDYAESLTKWAPRAGIVTFGFDHTRVYPGYDVMGINKSAAVGTMRSLVPRISDWDHYTVINCLETGPVHTVSSSQLPDQELLLELWAEQAPLGWTDESARAAIVEHSLFLLSGPLGYTGKVHVVDGGRAGIGAHKPKSFVAS